MQQGRGGLDSFPETIDLNQGSLPNTNSMDQSDSWNTMLNPVENRLSNYMLSTTDENVNRTNAANDHAPSFSFWDRGESSSSTSNIQDGAHGDDSKTRLGWSPSLYTSSRPDIRPEDWHFEPSSSSRYPARTLDGNEYFREHDGHRQMELNPAFYASSSDLGTPSSSSSTFSDINDASANWGSSCKRKALEGTSKQFYPGGSSSSIRPMEWNVMQHPPAPTCYPGPRNLSISSGTLNLSPSHRMEHLNPSSGSGSSNVPPVSFPSSGVGESSARNFSLRSNHGRHESVPSDLPRGTSVRHFGVNAAQLSRPIVNSDSSELRMPAPHLSPNSSRPHLSHVNEVHSYHWDGSFGSRGGSSSSSFMTLRERGSGAREESNVQTSGRNNLEYLMAGSSPETRNISGDQIDWSFAPGTSASSRNQPSVPRIGLGSGGQNSSTGWLPHENQTPPNHQQPSEPAPWIPFPHAESESGNRRRYFAVLPSASSSDEAGPARRAQHQLRRSSAAFLMDMPSDDVNGWRALAAVEGRHRLIRQVLNAMRRGAHLQAEDYMFIDPFINGIAEMHDRHRDMRLDVDNMSYEELLALEERIGNVSTGLSDDKIMGFMKQRKHEAMGVSQNLEPCCICQENYVAGDDIGILDCGHEFHAICIKQWLALKNLCPICKTTALEM